MGTEDDYWYSLLAHNYLIHAYSCLKRVEERQPLSMRVKAYLKVLRRDCENVLELVDKILRGVADGGGCNEQG